jgi:amino acid adenylation domain-containing protein
LRDRFFEEFPEVELHNLYGPTEAAVDATYWQCLPDQREESVPIGFPIANMQTFVLDEDRRRVLPSVVGELHLAGIGLADGYWDHPELTKERFFEWEDRGRFIRLYRTGDRALIRKDGALSAIEAVVRRHSQVADCAVIAQPSEGDQRLLAFIASTDELLDLNELRLIVQQSLPASHRPYDWIRLDRLPLTASGKLDQPALLRQAYRKPVPTRSTWDDPREALLAGLFGGLLDRVPSSPTSDFFELGGDSLRALQLRAALADAGYDLPLEAIFETPSLSALAARMTRRSDKQEGPVRPFALIENYDSVDRLRQRFDDAFPLSRLQQILVFHSRDTADYETYVLRLSLRGRIKPELLRAGLARLAARHSMLRASYDFNEPSPIQCIHRAVEIPLQIVEHSGKSNDERENEIVAAIQAEQVRKFDWTVPALIRFRLDHSEDDRVDLTVSHPIFDGWSLMTLLTELLSDVVAHENEQPYFRQSSPRGGMPDLVREETASVQSEFHREFWLRKLSEGFVSPAKAGATPRRRRQEVRLEPRITASLRRRAIAERIPLKSILLSIHLAVEGFHRNARRPTTGLIVNGRSAESDGERAVGLFLNTVPLGVSLAGQNWRTLGAATFAAERELWPHRHFPYVEIQRLAGGAPFESAFNFVHFHVVKDLLRLDGIEVLGWSNPSDFTFFPFAAYFVDDPIDGRLLLYLDYDEYRFPTSKVECLAALYDTALERATDPNRDVQSNMLLSLPNTDVRRATENRPTRIWSEPEVPVHNLVAAIIETRPDAIAIAGPGDGITYSQLWRRAGELSGALLENGLRAEEPVALGLTRDWRMVAGMLGIMRAGGAFVSFNPSDNLQRQRESIAQLGIRHAISEEPFAVNHPDLIHISPHSGSITRDGPSTCGSLAYIVTTSGSTGTPKGVEVEHQALRNTLLAVRDAIKANQSDDWLCISPITFDIAILELLIPLLTGSKMTISPENDIRDGVRLRKLLERTSWTFMQATPSFYRLAIEAGWRGKSNQKVLCGGEPLARSLADQLLDRVGEVWNCYGPCEATIWATLSRVTRGLASPNIGGPLDNTWAEIRNDDGQSLLIGSVGEIVLGGAGLARGYRNDSIMTARRFTVERSERVYRTGDLGRVNEKGLFEYLGRCDRQVKIRGFRIEPAEIESALMSHEGICAAAVVSRRFGEEDVRLIAFYTAGSNVPNLYLREYLAGILPVVMIPAEFRRLNLLPLTTNGKVDYLRLVEMAELPAAESTPPIEPPRGELETCIARSWCEVLALPNISRRQNFFSLGGHSLLALQASMRIEAETGLQVPPTALFQAPTVEALACWLSAGPDDVSPEAHERARLRISRQRRRIP